MVVPVNRDRPWVMRTYSGHSSAAASNELYRLNLSKGQTGLSVAFDLPTQTGYDSDDPLARGEVGKVGVPISHIGDMERLFDQIPLEAMNTSMTINGTAAWLLALYIAVAEKQGVDPAVLKGTTQNDIIKEYLSRGTYIFPPAASMRLKGDIVRYTVREVPKWNPTNVCSYHLQEAGATPVQEVAYALAAAIAILDEVKSSGEFDAKAIAKVVGRISFFVNSGIRFVEEICKLRAFGRLWDEITRERYEVEDPAMRRFRYGVQVNSLGLTEAQPENNITRIVLESLGVTLSKDARCRALQLPAWNEALGLPRPWDQQWSLRIQQVLAFETDILEYGDIFEGSTVIEAKVEEIAAAAKAELEEVLEQGGIVAAVDSGWVKQRLVRSQFDRLRRIEDGDQTVVGVNRFQETAESPLGGGGAEAILQVDEAAERDQIASLEAFRAERDSARAEAALAEMVEAAKSGANIMPSSIRCAHAGVTTGEWAGALRELFGNYRAPTGIAASGASPTEANPRLLSLREHVDEVSERIGHRPKVLIGKPGLDGHSNGAEQIAVACADAGLEVIYGGIRLSPEEIVATACDESVDIVGLSILSGSHLTLVPQILDGLRARGGGDIPLVLGGIVPDEDAETLKKRGVARIYTPKNYDLLAIIDDMVEVAAAAT
ncbi:MAG: protein meaA [Candidatus Binatia bacterium]|nr:protein meaA [Candidatus Binatia bacterium]MDG2009032.1 protein meaA [Candidatus Binatia bacterium]